LEIEIIMRQTCGFRQLPRLRTDRGERQTRRDHERLLRSTDYDIEIPSVNIERHRADARDRIDNEDRAGFAHPFAHPAHIMRSPCRGLRSLHEYATHVRLSS